MVSVQNFWNNYIVEIPVISLKVDWDTQMRQEEKHMVGVCMTCLLEVMCRITSGFYQFNVGSRSRWVPDILCIQEVST